MIIYIAAAIISLAIMTLGLYYVRYYLKKKAEGDENIKADFKPFLWAFIPITAVLACVFAFILTTLGESAVETIRYITAFCGLLLCSITDIKVKLIPNIICVGIIGAWLIELLVGSLFLGENITTELISSAIGALLGGGLLFIGRLISRSGMGMGDIKLMFSIGLLLKFDKTFGLLFWGLVFSLIFGVCLMIKKKEKAGLTICMAPFFFGGTAASIIISYISYIVYGG